MYPRNAASPERLAIGAVVQISDGAVQTSGVSVTVTPQGGSETAGGGTVSYSARGTVFYTPTQAETNHTSVIFEAGKTGCIPASTTVVTTDSATPGTVKLAGVTHTSAVIPTVTTLTGHTAQTGDAFARLGAPAGASISVDIAAVKTQTAAIETDTQDIQGRLPAALVSGRIDASVGAMASGVLTATAIAADAITAAKVAADVTAEIQSGLATAAALATVDTVVDGIAATLGAAGAGLTAVPWNAAWDAEVQSEVQDAIEVNHLDHLLAVTYDPGSKPGAADALLNELVESDAGVSRFTANALEQAPSGGGGVADWTADERTAIRSILGIPASGTTPDDPTTGILDTIRDAIAVVDGVADAILLDTAEIGAAGAGLTAVPWNAAWDAEVQSECTDALNAYDPPTNAEMVARTLAAADYATATAVADLPTNSELSTALAAADDAVLSAVSAVQSDVDVIREYADNTVIRGTVSTGTTTGLTPSALSPSGVDADQFKGRILVFDNDTTTAALRGQATDITASSAASLAVLTFTALTAAPQNGDTFSIV